MSKPISFGFGKQKPPSSLPSARLPTRKPNAPVRPSSTGPLRDDSDNEDEQEPTHESVTGFSSSGAILSKPVQETRERVIENPGNGDWRRRGRKNLLPDDVQAAQTQGGDVIMVERQEASTVGGLRLAEIDDQAPETNGHTNGLEVPPAQDQPKILTADEEAINALLGDGSSKPQSTAVIDQQGNTRLTQKDETQDFREDVASRPESCTLDEYAAMPVEEFGLAMLRGMGKKRRANGEVIDLTPKTDDKTVKVRKQEGFLGIGAKAAPGAISEIGAWGKADMRKNNKGEGFFTPLMRENKSTGERITEEEFQKRIKESKGEKPEEDWRTRRDRNLENSGRDRGRDSDKAKDERSYRDEMNSFSRFKIKKGPKQVKREKTA